MHHKKPHHKKHNAVSPHHHGWVGWQPPLPEEQDQYLLSQLLADTDQASAVHRLFQSCPPEIAAVGCLILRLSDQVNQLTGQLEQSQQALLSTTTNNNGEK